MTYSELILSFSVLWQISQLLVKLGVKVLLLLSCFVLGKARRVLGLENLPHKDVSQESRDWILATARYCGALSLYDRRTFTSYCWLPSERNENEKKSQASSFNELSQ